MKTDPKTRDQQDGALSERAADVARESKERLATAWAELVEAARTDPKAREFLAAFGMLGQSGTLVEVGDAPATTGRSDVPPEK